MSNFARRAQRVLLALLAAASFAGAAVAQEVVTYYHTDLTGSPIAASDASGNVVWREDFSPYGERLVQQSSAAENRMWFTGHHHDDASGLTYAGARHYDPMIGRFMGTDPAEADTGNQFGFNRYAYANNNPYRYVDPDGRETGAAFRGLFLLDGGNSQQARRTGPPSTGELIIAGGLALAVLPAVAVGGSELVLAALANPVTAAELSVALLTGDAVGPGTLVVGAAVAAKHGLTEARAARDALAMNLASLKGKAPATVTGGYNIKTGEVAARACSGGKCAEDLVLDALGGVKTDVRFTEAVRPRTGAEVPVCARCEASFGRDSFPSGTTFKTDQ